MLQSEKELAPGLVVVWPLTQLSQEVGSSEYKDAYEYLPMGQRSQVLALRKLPAAHGARQSVAATLFEVSVVLPVGHLAQAMLPRTALNMPAEHDLHLLLPEYAWYVPGMHFTHFVDELSFENSPAGHESQERASFLGLYLPDGQA